MRTKQANIRTKQANTRTKQANTRTKQANTRTKQANTRTKQANTRTKQANTRTKQANTRTKKAHLLTLSQALSELYSESRLPGSCTPQSLPGSLRIGQRPHVAESNAATAARARTHRCCASRPTGSGRTNPSGIRPTTSLPSPPKTPPDHAPPPPAAAPHSSFLLPH